MERNFKVNLIIFFDTVANRRITLSSVLTEDDKILVCTVTVYKSLTNVMKPATSHFDNVHCITLTALITVTFCAVSYFYTTGVVWILTGLNNKNPKSDIGVNAERSEKQSS